MRRVPRPARTTEPLYQRAAALREESLSLRAEADLIRERTERVTRNLVSTILIGDRVRRSPPDEVFTFRAGRLGAAVGLARGQLRNWLERSGIDRDDAADITLAVSEACANAVEHPVRPWRQAFEVEARRTREGIELAVRDFGRWREKQADSHRGRGLQMIRELMDETVVVREPHATTLVMRRKRPPSD